MQLSSNFNLLVLKKFIMSHTPSPSKGDLPTRSRFGEARGWGVSVGISRIFLSAALVMGSLLVSSVVFAQSSDEPQELPKPKFKTTPPLFQEWSFNKDQADSAPLGFSEETVGEGSPGIWKVEADSSAPSRPQALILKPGCQQESCYHLLLADDTNVEYLDLSVRMKMELGVSEGKAGLVFSAKDNQNFYAVVVTPETKTLQAYLVQDGQAKLLGEEKVLPMEGEWHFLRVHRISYISHFPIECYFDNQLILHLSDSTLGEGKVGLITMGQGAFAFDNIRAVELLTERPLSRPPAY
jgi:hypothetical protein